MYFAYSVIMQYHIKVNTEYIHCCCRDGFPYYYDAIKWVYDSKMAKMWADEYIYLHSDAHCFDFLIKSNFDLWKFIPFCWLICWQDPKGSENTFPLVSDLSIAFLHSTENCHLLHKTGYFEKFTCSGLPTSVYIAIESVPHPSVLTKKLRANFSQQGRKLD